MSDICYIYGVEFIQECDKIPAVKFRASLVHALIDSYKLLKHFKIVPCIKACLEDLKLFHSSSFVTYMQNSKDLNLDDIDEEQLEFGLCYDCPPFEGMLDTMLYIAGGSLTAASLLLNNEAKIVINWNGGWHHAQRDEAEGFCYVNDIVIAIEKLKEKYKRILYVDLDIHHGNGVENAFSFTKTVFTLSFHKYEAGFYPGTGSVNDIGYGNGKGYTCNVPLKEGVSDGSITYLFDNICPEILSAYKPEAIVVQCGSDCLNGDPLGQSNLTHESLVKCVEQILKWDKPTMFLGGGGYNSANTARLWTYLTAVICEEVDYLSMDIPEHDFFLKYGPDYQLPISKGYQKDTNTQDYLKYLVDTIKENLTTHKVKVE